MPYVYRVRRVEVPGVGEGLRLSAGQRIVAVLAGEEDRLSADDSWLLTVLTEAEEDPDGI